MGVEANATKADDEQAREVPTIGLGDVLTGNVKKKAREFAEKQEEDRIREEKARLK